MEITYAVIVAVITLVLGAITKVFVDTVPDRFIPLQNLIIGIISAIICLIFKVETDILQAFVLCIIASLGAGGAYDLVMTKIKNDK
mgnify:CR=1 FL=1